MMTPKQKLVLDEISKYFSENGHSPSIRDLSERLGNKSHSTIHGQLEKLRKAGYVDWDRTHIRTLKVVHHA